MVLCQNTMASVLTPESRWNISKPMLALQSTMCRCYSEYRWRKELMYAITWNEAGNRMIQIGIEPKRSLKELKQNEISASK